MSLVLVLQSLKIHRIKREGLFQLLFILSLLFFAWFNLYPVGDPGILEIFDQISESIFKGDFTVFNSGSWLKPEHLLYLGFQLILQAVAMIISWVYLYLFLGGKPTYRLRSVQILRFLGYFLLTAAVFAVSLVSFFIPFIIFYFFTFYAMPLLMTENIGIVQAMRKSYRVMKTNFSVIFIGNVLINLFIRVFSLLLLLIAPNQFATVLFASFLMVVLLFVRGRFRGILFDSFYRRPIINFSRSMREQEPEEVLQRLLVNLKTEATAAEIAKAQLRRREEELVQDRLQKELQTQLQTQLLEKLEELNKSDKEDEH